jgi:hypothetical protein
MEYWNDGAMERWNNGPKDLKTKTQHSIIPRFQFSTTSVFHHSTIPFFQFFPSFLAILTFPMGLY